MRVTQWSPTTGKFLSKRPRPCRTNQVEALAEAIVMVEYVFERRLCRVIRVDFQRPNREWVKQYPMALKQQ